ncbi:unnamed protein product, partial [Mycena citricolor]
PNSHAYRKPIPLDMSQHSTIGHPSHLRAWTRRRAIYNPWTATQRAVSVRRRWCPMKHNHRIFLIEYDRLFTSSLGPQISALFPPTLSVSRSARPGVCGTQPCPTSPSTTSTRASSIPRPACGEKERVMILWLETTSRARLPYA